MCYAYWNTYKLPVVIVRCFNTYGARQSDSGYAGAIPLFIKRVMQGLPPIIYGTGEQTRDYMYVKDTVQAYDLVLKSGDKLFGKAVNFGTGNDVSINKVAEIILSCLKSNLKPVHAPERPGEVTRLCCNAGLAKNSLGFKPQYDINQGLCELIEWYQRGNYEGWVYA
jgi:UDP-glucose 4-epimerase